MGKICYLKADCRSLFIKALVSLSDRFGYHGLNRTIDGRARIKKYRATALFGTGILAVGRMVWRGFNDVLLAIVSLGINLPKWCETFFI